jgi:hypothetical protein
MHRLVYTISHHGPGISMSSATFVSTKVKVELNLTLLHAIGSGEIKG